MLVIVESVIFGSSPATLRSMVASLMTSGTSLGPDPSTGTSCFVFLGLPLFPLLLRWVAIIRSGHFLIAYGVLVVVSTICFVGKAENIYEPRYRYETRII